MPGPYRYPEVYIEEVPSAVRTIVGVSTSDTAFIDFFARGPVNQPVRITSFADFERTFGGVDPRSAASYGIRQYYLNGGNVAWVVRVTAGDAKPASRVLTAGSIVQATLRFEAANPGTWGSRLRIALDRNTADPDKLFNLVVREVELAGTRERVVASEVHRNLSVDPRGTRTVSRARGAVDARAASRFCQPRGRLYRLSSLKEGLWNPCLGLSSRVRLSPRMKPLPVSSSRKTPSSRLPSAQCRATNHAPA